MAGDNERDSESAHRHRHGHGHGHGHGSGSHGSGRGTGQGASEQGAEPVTEPVTGQQVGERGIEQIGDDAPPELVDVGGHGYIMNVDLSRLTNRKSVEEHLANFSKLYALKGVLFTIVGVIAILFPSVFGLAVETLLGWCLVLGGGITLILFCVLLGVKQDSIPFMLLGILHFAVGLWLLVKPIQGLQALTFVLTGWFLVHGCVKIVMAYRLRHVSTWPAVLISGLFSVALGILIVILIPTYGLQLLGIMFGVDLLVTGVSVLLISLIAFIKLARSPKESDSEAAREPLLNNGSAEPVSSA